MLLLAWPRLQIRVADKRVVLCLVGITDTNIFEKVPVRKCWTAEQGLNLIWGRFVAFFACLVPFVAVVLK